jgi:hypothetical protein
MKMVRSLLLGSAAGIAAVTGAQAADLPVKAKPVEYVKVCSIYGAGFYYIPGTDTCLKVGGYVRMDVGIFAGGSHSPYVNGVNGRDTRETSWYQSRVRGILSWDARTQTEYGTLRAYINAGFELNSGDANYRGIQFFSRAFLQFAGLTAGKTQSFFGFYAHALNYSTLFGGGQSDSGLNLLAYTAQFGGGFSATLSLEDQSHHNNGLWDVVENGLTNSAIPGGGAGLPGYGDTRGNTWPDIVANLRVDQPWGSAQLSAAIHQVAGLYVGADSTGPSAGSEVGWAIQAGVKFNLPWAQGDTFWLQGTWARGASHYLGFSPFVHAAGQWGTYRGGRFAADRSFAGAWFLDGVFDGGGVELTEGWSIIAAVEHYWTPALRTSLFGHYTELTFPGRAGAVFCAGAAVAGGGGNMTIAPINCDPDFNIVQIGTRTIWSPVRNLDIGLEILYSRLDQNFGNAGGLPGWTLGAQGSRPAGAYFADDHEVWSGTVRFERRFWP